MSQSEIQRERDAIRQQVAQALGDDARQTRVLVGHLRSIGFESDILALPVARSSEIPIQVIDPNDPNFGAMRFISGVSRLDGSDVLI